MGRTEMNVVSTVSTTLKSVEGQVGSFVTEALGTQEGSGVTPSEYEGWGPRRAVVRLPLSLKAGDPGEWWSDSL